MFSYQVTEESKKSRARRGLLKTTHGPVETPVFMPVGTLGSVKGIAPEELKALSAEIILANTYHLYLRPGIPLIEKMGGIHKFIGWDRPILTDSGGFQVFSLAKFMRVGEDGVHFASHLDGSPHHFTPEKVVDIQLRLGVDIAMVLDICTDYSASRVAAAEDLRLTTSWAKQAKAAHRHSPRRSKTALFGIVQGGMSLDLRKQAALDLGELDFEGYAIGGNMFEFGAPIKAVVGQKQKMWEILELLDRTLPREKPRYLMGIGEPSDIIEAVRRGVDMFDCVLPTRIARHGSVWIWEDLKKWRYDRLDLKRRDARASKGVIDQHCGCYTCKNGFSRAYLGHLIKSGELLGMRLATLHNLFFLTHLIAILRAEITAGRM